MSGAAYNPAEIKTLLGMEGLCTDRQAQLLTAILKHGSSNKAAQALRCDKSNVTDAVRVVVEPGNHDPYSMLFMQHALAALYEKEKRIEIDTTPGVFHYHEFGKCLIGVHHGDKAKMDKLPLIMASDQPDAWGRTEYRYWWTGHIHQDKGQDVQGVKVESFRVLPPTDAWAHGQGYRSQRSMVAIVFHKDFGEEERHTVNPAMLESA